MKKPSPGADRFFSGLAAGSGLFVIVLIGLIGAFLLIRAVPSLAANHADFFLSTQFRADSDTTLAYGIRDLFLVTVFTAALALAIAMPISLGIATFLTYYAPPSLRRVFSFVVDILAAVPSIIFGLWGILVLGSFLQPLEEWLNDHLGWFFLFATGNVSVAGGGTIFTAGVVLAIMLLPIITATTREVFRQAPVMQIEGAYALGATKWEMIRTVVYPFGRSGYIAASMLGLGRALGETVAVLMILRSSPKPMGFSLFDGGFTFASKIAIDASEFTTKLTTGAYVAAGLVLFVLTFVVNAIARAIASGKKAA
jgi:phosphate transport system permease protein